MDNDHRPEAVLLVETRDRNSHRKHFNRQGDWLPRLIIWPEYDGVCTDEVTGGLPEDYDKAWAAIIAETVQAHCRERGYALIRCEAPRKSSLFERLIGRNRDQIWTLQRDFVFDETFVRSCEEYYEPSIFLLLREQDVERLPDSIEAQHLDRANLLVHGEVMFNLGIEEPVCQLCFHSGQEQFLLALERACEKSPHRLEMTEKHFVSHWVMVNPSLRNFDDDYREFDC